MVDHRHEGGLDVDGRADAEEEVAQEGEALLAINFNSHTCEANNLMQGIEVKKNTHTHNISYKGTHNHPILET